MATTGAPRADLLLVNGRILTLTGARAEALAIRGDRILAVGAADELAPLRSPRTKVLDLGGRLAVPGFTDSHLHLGALAARLSEVNLKSARSLAEALRLVRRRARATVLGEWITGGGFDKNRWGDAFPTKQDLDGAALEHPVALRSRDGHSLWCNSRALAQCGISRATRAPSGGAIIRDADGEPTGILQEAAARLVREDPLFAERTPDSRALSKGCGHLLRRGVTSAHLMEEMPLFGALQGLRAEGKLTLRVTLYRGRSAMDDLIAAGVRSGFGDEWLRIGGIKILSDGALGSQTAWMFEPYAGGCDRGLALMPLEELRETVARAAQAGLACAIHAIGDRANAEVITAFEMVSAHQTPLPHRIEHAQLLRGRDLRRVGRLRGLVASMQPCHIPGDIDTAERYWGRRSRYAYPIRSLRNAGATLAFGSDAPVETADPMVGLYAATARQTLDGRPSGGWYRSEEGITQRAALRAYTTGPAAATAESAIKGRLEPGYLADIVVLSQDITRLRGRALLDVRPDLVIVGGRVRYRRRDAGL